MLENLNYTPDLMAGFLITGIVSCVSVVFPTLLYWVLQIDVPLASSGQDSEASLSTAKSM